MSAPFQPGDVVVCVAGVLTELPPMDRVWLGVGLRYSIEFCELADDEITGEELWGVRLREDPNTIADPDGLLPAHWFRKIDDEQIPEVLERLKSLGKQRERVS